MSKTQERVLVFCTEVECLVPDFHEVPLPKNGYGWTVEAPLDLYLAWKYSVETTMRLASVLEQFPRVEPE